jgi:predicted RNase H-like HicB family nuclease
MLTRYIQAALSTAKFEWLDESQLYYGEIPELPGVWATGTTLDECRTELQETLEDWVALGLAMNHHIPVISGIDVNVEPVR